MSRWPLTIRGTGALLLALVCFVAAHTFTIIELLYVSALLTVIVGVSIATLYLVRRTEKVSRAFRPDVAAVGSDVAVRMRVEIRSPLPGAQGLWSDALPDGIVGDATGVFPGTGSGMRPGSRAVQLDYTVLATRRGIHAVGPVSVVMTDPFGFARRRHTIGAALPLTVTPTVVELGPLAEQPGEAGGSRHTATDHLGQGADNLIPRHYMPGDSRRRIHWRASAHRDQLMVRQEEQETTPEAIVVLDRGTERWDVDAERAPGADPGFESAVSACVSVATRLVQEGYVVSVLDADGTPIADPIDGGDITGAAQLAIDLATITAHRGHSPEALVALLAGTTTGPLVFVTGAIAEPDAAALTRLAAHSALPVLLAVTPRGNALAYAESAGWRVAAIPPGADLAAAWDSILDHGAARVSR